MMYNYIVRYLKKKEQFMKNDIYDFAMNVALFRTLKLSNINDSSLSRSEISFLVLIHNSKEEMTGIKISKYFGCSKVFVSKVINMLVGKKLITKTLKKEDHRSYILVLTEKGNKFIKKYIDDYVKTISYLYEKMGEEKAQELKALLEEARTIINGYQE